MGRVYRRPGAHPTVTMASRRVRHRSASLAGGGEAWRKVAFWLVPAMVVVWTGLFSWSYLGALGQPTPHRVPVALVAPTPVAAARVAANLRIAAPGAIDVRPYDSGARAHAALLARRVDGILVVGPRADTLYVAEAAGQPIVGVLQGELGAVAARQHMPLVVRDLVPLPARDASGLGLFYLVLACVLGGYVGTLMILAHSGPLPPAVRVLQLAATAVLIGAATTTADRFLLGADPLPQPDTALVAALAAFAVATGTWALLAGIRRLAVPAAFGIFIILGNPSSGGAIPRVLLPAAYSEVSGWLPNGAAVSALRDLTFFPTASTTSALLVLAAWTVAGLGCALVLARRGAMPRPDKVGGDTAPALPLNRT